MRLEAENRYSIVGFCFFTHSYTIYSRQFFSYRLIKKKKRKSTYFWSTSIWMRFLFKRDCGDHVPFCFIAIWTVCSSGKFFFGSWSPLYNRAGILSKKGNHQKSTRHESWAKKQHNSRQEILLMTKTERFYLNPVWC